MGECWRRRSGLPFGPDTDNDGVSDAGELRFYDTDPTLHDVRPPEVQISRADFAVNETGTNFLVVWAARDPSGLGNVKFVKEGDVVAREAIPDEHVSDRGKTTFSVGLVGTTADVVTGSTVKVKAKDTHGNTKTDVALQRQNFYGNLAGELNEENIYTLSASGALGTISGYSTALGRGPRAAKQSVERLPAMYQALREDPLGFIDGIERLITILKRNNILKTIIDGLLRPVVQKQKQNNPYDKQRQTQFYENYEKKWYGGYIAGMLSGGLLTKGAATTVKGLNRVQKFSEAVGETRPGQLVKLVNSKRAAVNRKVAGTLAKGAGKVGGTALSGAKTVGGTIRLYQLQRRADVDTSDLSKDEQTFLNSYLRRGGSDAADQASQLEDEGELQQFLRRASGGCEFRFGAATSATALTGLRDDCTELSSSSVSLSDDVIDRFGKLRRNGDLTRDELRAIYSALDNGELTEGDVRRLSKVIAEDDGFKFDDDIDIQDLVKSSNAGSLEGTRAIIRPDNGRNGLSNDRVTLKYGNKDRGWNHLILRHVSGYESGIKDPDNGITTFWPVGQRIGDDLADTPRKIDDAMTIPEVNRAIAKAINKGDAKVDGNKVYYHYDGVNNNKIDSVCVVVQGGEVTTAWPLGSDIDKLFGDGRWNLASGNCPV